MEEFEREFEAFERVQLERLIGEILPSLKEDAKRGVYHCEARLPADHVIADFYRKLVRFLEDQENQYKQKNNNSGKRSNRHGSVGEGRLET